MGEACADHRGQDEPGRRPDRQLLRAQLRVRLLRRGPASLPDGGPLLSPRPRPGVLPPHGRPGRRVQRGACLRSRAGARSALAHTVLPGAGPAPAAPRVRGRRAHRLERAGHGPGQPVEPGAAGRLRPLAQRRAPVPPAARELPSRALDRPADARDRRGGPHRRAPVRLGRSAGCRVRPPQGGLLVPGGLSAVSATLRRACLAQEIRRRRFCSKPCGPTATRTPTRISSTAARATTAIISPRPRR